MNISQTNDLLPLNVHENTYTMQTYRKKTTTSHVTFEVTAQINIYHCYGRS